MTFDNCCFEGRSDTDNELLHSELPSVDTATTSSPQQAQEGSAVTTGQGIDLYVHV
jgi:hypothetical protein